MTEAEWQTTELPLWLVREYPTVMSERKARLAGCAESTMRRRLKNEEKEQAQLERWRWFRNLFRGTMGWVTFLIWVAGIALAGFGAYLLIRYGFRKLVNKLENMTQE